MSSTPLYKQIREKYQLGPANHMTHISNLEGILRNGEIRSYNLMRGHAYQNLANEDVQAGRAAKKVPITGGPLHDYVPLYFGNRTPMVAVNSQHNESIVFLRFSLDILALPGVVVTDGNARSNSTKFRTFEQVTDLDFVDPKAINTVKYASDAELKRRKQAEILVPDRISLSYLYDLICYSQAAAKRLLAMLNAYDKKLAVQVSPGNWYFRPRQEKS